MSRAGSPARFDCSEYVSLLELLERCSAEVGIEPLTVDRNGLEFAQVRVAGYFVVLVALIPLQTAQLNSLGATLEKIGVVVSVLGRDQNDVYVGPVGRLEVCQAENQLPVCLLIDRGAARVPCTLP